MKKNDTNKRIYVAPKLKNILTQEFGTSKVAVNNALNGITNSYLAKQIRKRAKELMLAEIEKIKD